jgi:DNA polymerase I-like protein with 3'-5' exonuclease and polymerase domains
VVLTPGRLAETVEYLQREPEGILSFDMETSGDNRGVPFCNSASWIVLAARGRVAVIPFGHPIGSKVTGITKEPRPTIKHKTGETVIKMFKVPVYEGPPPQMDRAEVFDMLKPLFFPERKDQAKVLIGHGMQFDLATIAKYYDDEIPPGPHCDTIVLRWLLDENRKRFGLKYITREIYGFSYDDEDVGKCVEKHPFNKVAHYLNCDVVYPLYEYRQLRPQIDKEGLQQVYKLEMDLLPILARMRLTGVHVDRQRLEEMR